MAARGFRILRRNQPNLPFSIIVESSRLNRSLILESSAILTLDNNDTTAEYKKAYTKLLDAYGLMGILRVSKDEPFLLAVTGVLSMGQLHGCDIYRITMVQFVSLKSSLPDPADSRIVDLQRLISSGIFYFAISAGQSTLIDLTLCAQKRVVGDACDHRFFWNRSLHFPLERYGINPMDWFLRVMCGSVQIRTVYLGHRTAKVAVLSRLSCERVGTRFNVRGVNDDGHVANFVETEQLIIYEGHESSFVQIRGSVPLFWEQPGVNVGTHKVKLRAFEASAPAFDRHFRHLKRLYGSLIVVNLLGSKEGERTLTEAFKAHHKNSVHGDIDFISFDYHAQMKISKTSVNLLMNKLNPTLAKYSFFHAYKSNVLRSQCGAVRANCLDCLDRTNSVQTLIGLQVLPSQLECLPIEVLNVNIGSRFEEVLKDLWQKNGDFCSVIYAGTGALEGKSKFKDASRSLARTIQNNLMDSSKQESFDLFLFGSLFGDRLFDHVANLLPPVVVQECPNAVETLVERGNEMVTEVPLTVFTGTWNVNGGKNMHNIAFRNQAPLSEWLFPKELLLNISGSNFNADVVAIGLEEIIDLNASNIVKASTTNQRLWCDGLRKALSERSQYVLLGCEQLVGVCLFVFVKPHLTSAIREFAVDSVKTGMGGAAGNKGSVALRLTIHATSFCFVCSHFAAGQNEIRDRNEDFMAALHKLRFPMGREVLSHDIIFWMGDFNYRISLPGEEVKKAIKAELFAQLVPNDQLTQQRALGYTFVDFEEGKLNFAPTYKYDTFSDDYDTSEKCRSPAWTDRILWKDTTRRKAVQLIRYGRAELKTSDHRPVSAVFLVIVWKVDLTKCALVYEDVASCMGPPDATVLVSVDQCDSFPVNLYYPTLQKLGQLGIQPLLSKFEGAELWLVLENGEMALAALSMDGVYVEGSLLHVKLRSPDWTKHDNLQIDGTLQVFRNEMLETQYSAVGDGDNFEFDDDDEEIMSLKRSASQLSLQQRPSPAREVLEAEPSRTDLNASSQILRNDLTTGSRPGSFPQIVSTQLFGPSSTDPGEPKQTRAPQRPAPPRPVSRSNSPWQACAEQKLQDPFSCPADPFNASWDASLGNVQPFTAFETKFAPAVPPRPNASS